MIELEDFLREYYDDYQACIMADFVYIYYSTVFITTRHALSCTLQAVRVLTTQAAPDIAI